MEEINGEFIMKGCAEDDPSRLDTPEELVSLLSRIGFLPLFSNTIRTVWNCDKENCHCNACCCGNTPSHPLPR